MKCAKAIPAFVSPSKVWGRREREREREKVGQKRKEADNKVELLADTVSA